MTEENVELVRRLYRAMNARDVDGVAALAHPDVEWIPDRRVGEGPVRGLENVIAFFVDRAEMFDEAVMEVERLFDADGKVVAFLRVAGRGQASGVEVEIRIAHLWSVRDGLVVRGEGYGDRRAALEAAGLSEQPT
jgi:ketosteroid isomerase-like protein